MPAEWITRRQILGGLTAAAVPVSLRAATVDTRLAAAIAGSIRSPKNIARDRYRHPFETLSFFGLRNTQTVVEIEPGGGYWTEILAPYLRPHGQYIAAIPVAGSGSPEAERAWTLFLRKLQSDPAVYNKVRVTGLSDAAPIAPPGSADLVLSFRNLHDWMADGTAARRFAAIHAVLKSGGVLGIEDHRGLTTGPQDPRAKTGYVREDYAKKLITAAGFTLVAESPVGDNPRDTKDYPAGVWTLPPTLRLGAVDRAKYLAIGESDRWTMKFVKRTA